MSTFWWKLMARHQEVFVKCPEFQNRLYCACAHRRTRSFSMGGLDPFYSISTSPFQDFVRFKDNSHQLKKVWGPNHGHGYKLCIRVCLCTVLYLYLYLYLYLDLYSHQLKKVSMPPTTKELALPRQPILHLELNLSGRFSQTLI